MMGLQRPYHVERISTEYQLSALQEPWTDLLAGDPSASLFLSWEWVSTWWRHYGPGKELWVLVAWDASGRLAGIAPWMLVSGHLGPLRVRRIAFLGSGRVSPDHVDVITKQGEQEGVCGAFVRHLDAQKHRWDALDFQGLAQDSVLGCCLTAAPGRRLERHIEVSPFAQLPDDWGVFQKCVLSANRRQQVRRRRRELENAHGEQVVFCRVTRPQELPAAMDTLIALNKSRWHSVGRWTSFDDALFSAFHRDVAALALERRWLRLYQLCVSGQVVATVYGFRYGDVFYYYQSGFDMDWGRYSPGQLMIAHVIEAAIQEGVREFDMLRGRETYKFSWTDQAREDVHVVLSHNWRGLFWLLGVGLWGEVISAGRKVLPQKVRDHLNRVLARKPPRGAAT